MIVPGVVALAAAHRSGARTVAETVEALLAALADDPQPVAWLAQVSPADLRARAAALDAGPRDLPLLGVPFAVKDNIDTLGLPTTAGCPSFAYAPPADAEVVARLLAAGAVLVGRTTMDQFATGLVGTRAPGGAPSSVFGADLISGGSSSGSAVVVAAGLVAFALGTDTAGSGRVPAAFNGIVGLKPSLGLVPTAGVVPACRSLDAVSVFARSSEDAAAVLAVAGPPPPAAFASRIKIGVPRAEDLAALEPGPATDAWHAAVERGAGLGELVEVDLGPFLEAARLLYAGPWIAERYAAFGAHLDHDDVDPTVRQIVAPGRDVTGVEVFEGQYRLAELRARTAPVWDAVDVLLVPTAPHHPTFAQVAADPVGVNSRLGTWTNFVNLLDLAALAVPATGSFGVTFVAPRGTDAALLDLGRRWEARATVPLAVVGAHLSGLPRNPELVACGARLEGATTSAAAYRLYDLADGTGRPGMVRDDEAGATIELEVWRMPVAAFGRFVAGVAAPLAIGTVELADGRCVHGFICEAHAVAEAPEVTHHGGWRSYLTGVPA